MIKSEIKEESSKSKTAKKPRGKKKEAAKTRRIRDGIYYFIAMAVVTAGVLAFGSYVAVNNNSIGSAPNDTNQSSGQPLTLPLSVSSGSSQSSAVGSGLSASAVNLQDNVGGSAGKPKTSSLQSGGTGLYTGQTINPNLPY